MTLGDESYAANHADSVVFLSISSPLQPAQPCPITMYEPIRTMMRREPTATVLPGSPLSTGAYTCQAAVDASGQYVYLAEGAGVFGFAIYN
jgi:hypothetical protein